jgi:TATA-box binding protein (TBP) (component of TFIID and TFIIIB)
MAKSMSGKSIKSIANPSFNIDDEWLQFMSKVEKSNESDSDNDESEEIFQGSQYSMNDDSNSDEIADEAPKASEIYISTKSKIAYLNSGFDLKEIFWKIPVIPYAHPKNGVIKKQIKFNSSTIEELNIIQERLKTETYYEEHIITSINNPTGRIKFKDIRKISIGISKKDIMSYRRKKKSAFYNCFVMIMRIKIGEEFKEFHIKVFNTGKMEIPGIQSDAIFEQVLNNIVSILQPHVGPGLAYNQKSDTVLINSNFNCGFYINREALSDILKYKYKIQCIYDPTSYPGIQCKFYFNPDKLVQSGSQISEEDKHLYSNVIEVSFMIFRTGSILIVGMCEEMVLYSIYEYLKNILTVEYHKIHQKNNGSIKENLKDKKKKVRRKCIIINVVPEPTNTSLDISGIGIGFGSETTVST